MHRPAVACSILDRVRYSALPRPVRTFICLLLFFFVQYILFFFFFSLASDACRSASKLTLHCTDLFLAPPQIWGLQPFLSVQTPSQWVLCVTCDGNLPEAFVRGHIRWNGRRSSGGVCCSFILFYPLLDCSLSSSFLLLRQRPIRSLEPFHSMWR